MKIIIEPHDPAWISEFNRTKGNLQKILSDVSILSIEHVGSTSIPGLLAKPVLDIDIIVASESVPGASVALVKAGYTALGDQGVPFRFAFRQPVFQKADQTDESRGIRGEMRRNTYVIVDRCIALRNHLDLKRMLLENEELRDKYGEVKRGLVNGGVQSMSKYCKGKNEVVLKILERAGWDEDDLEEVSRANSRWWAAWRMGLSFVRGRIKLFWEF